MDAIWLQKFYQIIGDLRTDPAHGPYSFVARAPGSYKNIDLEISSDGARITSRGKFTISSQLIQWLGVSSEEEELPDEFRNELLDASHTLSLSCRRLLNLLQQETEDHSFLPHNKLAGTRDGLQWSTDGSEWHSAPFLGANVAVSARRLGKLDEKLRNSVLELLDRGEDPLVAYEHLFHAERSDGLRFKWIEATIAAELAIKDVLMNIEPSIRPLLDELPSPPLRKLYGPILEQYTGQRSPYVGKLNRGSEIRNRLIHRTEETDLERQEVLDYLGVVRAAIRHLLELQREVLAQSD